MVTHDPLKVTGGVKLHRGLALSERRLLLAGGDLVAIGLAFVIAFNVRTAQVRHLGLSVPRGALGITLITWLLAAQLVDAHRLSGTVSLRGTFGAVIGSMAISFVGLLGVFFILPYRISRPTLLLWLPVATVGLLAWRVFYRRLFARAIFAGSLAVVADQPGFETVWPDASAAMHGLYRVVEVVSPDRPDCAERLQELVTEGRVDQIVLGVRDEVSRSLFRSLLECYDHGVPVRSLSDVYEELTGRMLLDQLGHTWLLGLPMRSQTSRVYAWSKRALDVLSGFAGLAVLGVILPFAALATKLEDHGPIFYRQPRVGRYGHPFDIYKLRTMKPERRAVPRQTEDLDVRITRVGRLLRQLHFDELPQGWNLVKGEMSLIGPRPEQPGYVELLKREIDFYNTRLSVRPGLTGWAQINYGYGAGVEGARVKLSYDLYYIKRQSVALDLLILVRTFFAVVALGGR